jgi:hypothetical protein
MALILLIAALIAFILDTIGISSRVNLTALELALLTLSMLLGSGPIGR